jgi:hypothetical protein
MERGERILEAIEDDVVMRLNPSGDECWYCGGEGYTHDCFDGFCEAAEYGCADCSRPCRECTIFNGRIAKAVREEVIKSGDAEVAVAWLKSIGRWNDGITMDRVRAELEAAKPKD